MDIFGLNKRIKKALIERIYSFINSNRGTGKTTHLASKLKTGDFVICININDAKEIKYKCKKKNKQIKTIVCDPNYHDIMNKTRGIKENIYLDHRVIEEYWIDRVESIRSDLKHLLNAVNRNNCRNDYFEQEK